VRKVALQRRVGLALGGGGARGIAHIGVLAELEAENIPVHLIAGTSAGSLVGALYAAGLSPDQLLALAQRTTWRDLVHLTLPRVGLVNAEPMQTLLNDIFGNGNIEDLPIPFAAVTCDLVTGQEVVITKGNIAVAVRASCSIPGIFVPVPHGNYLLVDGGLVNGVPVSVAKSMGSNMTIAVRLNQGVTPSQHLHNIFGILAQAAEIMQRSQHMAEPDILISPDITNHSMADLNRVLPAYFAGRTATQAALPDILENMRKRG